MARKYSDYYHWGVLDSDLRIMWSENNYLFRRLTLGVKKLVKFKNNTSDATELIHEFVAKGVHYIARMELLKNGTYICRISRELGDDEVNSDGFREFLDNASEKILSIHHANEQLIDYAHQTKSELKDTFHDNFRHYVNHIRRESGSLYSDCNTLIQAFDDDYNEEYVPILKYIMRSWDMARYATRKLKNSFEVCIDTIFTVMKVDYSKFELAFFTMIKLALIFCNRNVIPMIKIQTIDECTMEMSADFPLCDDFNLNNFGPEIRLLKHIFHVMGGVFEFQEYSGRINAVGVICTEMSWDTDDISKGRNICYIGGKELNKEKETAVKYVSIYENDKERKLRLKSPVQTFDDLSSSQYRFAEMVFSKVFLYRNE